VAERKCPPCRGTEGEGYAQGRKKGKGVSSAICWQATLRKNYGGRMVKKKKTKKNGRRGSGKSEKGPEGKRAKLLRTSIAVKTRKRAYQGINKTRR